MALVGILRGAIVKEAALSDPSSTPCSHDAGPLAGTQTLMRGLAVINAVAAGMHDLKALHAHLGLPRSTTHRLATGLVQARYLRVVPGLGYALGPRLIELGYQAREAFPVTALARPHLERLAALTNDTIHLAVRDGQEALYLEKIAGKKGLEMRSRVGSRMPLAVTGVGKALMLDDTPAQWRTLYEAGVPVASNRPARRSWNEFEARMRDYASKGYAFDLEDNEPSIRCVAAPVRDASGQIVAAISVSSTTTYLSLERMAELAPVVRQCAATISRELGGAEAACGD